MVPLDRRRLVVAAAQPALIVAPHAAIADLPAADLAGVDAALTGDTLRRPGRARWQLELPPGASVGRRGLNAGWRCIGQGT